MRRRLPLAVGALFWDWSYLGAFAGSVFLGAFLQFLLGAAFFLRASFSSRFISFWRF